MLNKAKVGKSYHIEIQIMEIYEKFIFNFNEKESK